MTDYKDLCRKVRHKAAEGRCLARLTEGDLLAKAWATADEAEREAGAKLLLAMDKAGVEKWMKLVLAKDVRNKSLRELREMARACGVDYYHHKSKEELLKELT